VGLRRRNLLKAVSRFQNRRTVAATLETGNRKLETHTEGIMRLLLRLVCCLATIMLLVSLGTSYYQVRREKRRLRNELTKRAEVVGEGLEHSVAALVSSGAEADLQRVLERFRNKEHLLGVAVYSGGASPVAATSTLAATLPPRPEVVEQTVANGMGHGQFLRMHSLPLHYYAAPLHLGEQARGHS
jgi:hypothetical protein